MKLVGSYTSVRERRIYLGLYFLFTSHISMHRILWVRLQAGLWASSLAVTEVMSSFPLVFPCKANHKYSPCIECARIAPHQHPTRTRQLKRSRQERLRQACGSVPTFMLASRAGWWWQSGKFLFPVNPAGVVYLCTVSNVGLLLVGLIKPFVIFIWLKEPICSDTEMMF